MSDKNFLVLDYEDLNDRLSQVNEYLESCEYTKAASLLRDLHPADISNFFETKICFLFSLKKFDLEDNNKNFLYSEIFLGFNTLFLI